MGAQTCHGGPVVIMAGGTGGHVFPALAVAKVLRERGVPVVWLGVPDSMESRLVPANGFPIEWVRVRGIRGKGAAAWLAAPFRVAAAVLEAFPGSFGAGVKARTVGNPVRADIAGIAEPGERFAGRTGRARLLVFGGSQGAQRLNAAVPQALSRLDPARRPEIRHQAGVRGIAAARAAYQGLAVEAEVLPFIDDMAAAYAWADLALCRAGAMTIAELQAAGLGALLVPFAAATDDHQTKNAETMVRVGAGRVLPEAELTPERLSADLAELTADRARLLEMARAARGARNVDAAARLAELCVAAGGAAA